MVEAFNSHRILIVEDEYYLAADLELALQSQGADVVGPIAELSAALREVAKGGLDAAVIDINLQDEIAYELADELRLRSISFVFTTGYSQDVIPSRFSDVKRFEKPFEPAQVAQHVLDLCVK